MPAKNSIVLFFKVLAHPFNPKQKQIAMFGLFKKKTEVEKLQEKYQKLMKEAFDLSKVNRSEGDKKYAEADAVQKKIEELTGK
ncbi:Hypothetical protein I595_683 [Croceitalea dokdonensis DOKDO 023]|uniref:Lacal_2735 family protein n=1 Tax=Croceitalea dokdonensis DOKDO 023 TaxID=1300341 RepID=A0A0P7B4R6_9FLAO|nr:Hypothetical protein I595_683 [Croceitalea dokdonensis DOKDO 023]